MAFAVRLLPETELQNEQLLAQFPSLLQSLVPHASAEHPQGISITITQCHDGTGHIDVCVPESVDQQASEALSEAISAYLARSNCVARPEGPGHLALDRAGDTDTALAEIYALSSAMQRLGGDERALAKLLEHPLADVVASMFAGTFEPKSILLCEISGDHAPVVDLKRIPRPIVLGEDTRPVMTMVACTTSEQLLEIADAFDKAGLHAMAMDLLLGHLWSDDCDSPKSVCDTIRKMLLDQTLDANPTADIIRSLRLTSFNAAQEGCIGQLLDKLCLECDPPRLLGLAGTLMDGSMDEGDIVRMLQSAFEGAVENGDADIAQGAVDLLQELASNGNEEARKEHEPRASWLKDQDLQQAKAYAVVERNPYRQNLERTGFTLDLVWGTGNTPVLKPTGSTFLPGQHANDLILHAESVLQASPSPSFATWFAFPVVDFLLSQFPGLNRSQQLAVYELCAQCERVLPHDDSPPSGRTGIAAMARHLPPLILHSFLNNTLAAIQGPYDDALSKNAACWLLQNSSELFGHLADTLPGLLVKAGLPGSVPQGFTVDAQSARELLASALEPTLASLVRLFENNHLARLTSPEHPALMCWMTLTGTDDMKWLTAVLKGMGHAKLQSVEDWERARSVYENALATLRTKAYSGKTDVPLKLHKTLIDSIVSMSLSNCNSSLSKQIVKESRELLDKMSKDRPLLTFLSSSGHPNAAVWPAVASVQVRIDHALAPKLPVDLSDDEAYGVFTILKDCAFRSNVILDAKLQDAFIGAIQFYGRRDQSFYALSLLSVLYGSLINRMELDLALRPVGDLLLRELLSEFADAPGKHTDPKATMVAFVRAFCVLKPGFAMAGLEDVGERLAPQLACIGFLHVAMAFNSRGDNAGTSKAFARALTHLPTNDFERHVLTPDFEASSARWPSGLADRADR